MDRNSSSSSIEISPAPNQHDGKDFMNIPLGTFSRVQDVENNHLGNASPTPQDAQAGVKNIEAISMTWTKWGLIFAYAGYVLYIAVAKMLRG